MASLFVGFASGVLVTQHFLSAPSNAGHTSLPTAPSDQQIGQQLDALNQRVRALLSEEHAEHIVDKLRAETSDPHQHALMQMILQFWADENPTAALEYALQMENHAGRLDFLAVALGSMAQYDLTASLEWLDHLDHPQEREILLAAVYAGYAQSAPEAAMRAVEQMSPGYGRDRALAKVAKVWADQDVLAVFDWIETQPVDRRLQDIYTTAMTTYIEQEPENAGYLIEAMRPGSQKTALACQYAQTVASTDIQQALNWAEQLTDPNAQKEALAVTLGVWLDTDVRGAFDYALTTEGELSDTLLKQVAVHLSQDNPQNAVRSLSAFPSTLQPTAAREMARIWATSDPIGVTEWIATMSAGPTQDQAVRGAIHPLVNRAPETAFRLASSLQGTIRYDLMRYTAGAWYEVDPQAAFTAINADHVLTDDAKQLILAQLTRESAAMDLVLPARE